MNILTEDDIYFKTIVKDKIKLRPNFIDENFENNIEQIIKNKYEGRCIKEGYVVPDSIKILQRSIGNMNSNQFTGNIEFTVIYGVEICNIPKGCIIKAIVKNINKLGILAELGPLVIIIPKDLHESKEVFKKVEIGNTIDIFIIGKTFSLNNRRIQIYGKLHGSNINKTVSIKKKSLNNKSKRNFKNNENIFAEEVEEENVAEKFDEGQNSDFEDQNMEDEEEEMQEPVVEDSSEFQDELDEEGFPNELNEEIIDNETSEQDNTELDEEITL